jgi:class 3 adenylate cyclase/CheY-like chemotaxis protein
MGRNIDILIVEDSPSQAVKLGDVLEQNGYGVSIAEDGEAALDYLKKHRPTIIISDIIMPNMDGYDLCRCVKSDEDLRNIPVILLTQLSYPEDVIRGLECGADVFFTKPCDAEYLSSKIESLLENQAQREAQRLQESHDELRVTFAGREHFITSDRWQILNLLLSTFENAVRQNRELLEAQLELEKLNRQLEQQVDETERLLLNILPKTIADRLKQNQDVIADRFDEVTILFADVVGFTRLSAHVSPTELVALLNKLFSAFDRITERYGLEKIKTIGDKYMVASGLPIPRPDHVEAVAEMALDMQDELALFNRKNNKKFSIRVGINTGPVVAGVIGAKKFSYDLWGDTVNIASRMETHGIEGCIQVTKATYESLRGKYLFRERGMIQVKNAEEMFTYLLIGRRHHASRGLRENKPETASALRDLT